MITGNLVSPRRIFAQNLRAFFYFILRRLLRSTLTAHAMDNRNVSNSQNSARRAQPSRDARSPRELEELDAETTALFLSLLGQQPQQPRKKPAASDASAAGPPQGEKQPASVIADGSNKVDGLIARTPTRHGEQEEQNQGDGEQPPADGDGPAATGRATLPAGDAILQSMSQLQQPGEASPTAASQLDEVAQQIAGRILVSDPASGGREVRIILKSDILPEAEIRIVQDSGRLQVQFHTSSAGTQALLENHRAALQNRLHERLEGRELQVSVERTASSDSGAHDGRSRGQFIDPYDAGVQGDPGE